MIKPKYLLQLGLAFVFLFAGIDSFIHPFNWIGFVPVWVSHFGVSQTLALHAHALAEIALGLLLLSNWQIRIAASLAALDLLIIILANGFGGSVFLITFRDVGLLFTSLYLAILPG